MVFPFRSLSASPLISLFVSIVILLPQNGNPARGEQIIPPSVLPPGSNQYQLIFVTADTMAAASGDIADYNDFVRKQAARNPDLPPGLTWYALASTEATDAKHNAELAGAGDDIPIYNTHGELIADGISDLWESNLKGKILNAIKYDQFGTTLGDSMVWTGSQFDGTVKNISEPIIGPLGSIYPFISFGSPTAINYKWIDRGTLADCEETHSLYALSTPITYSEIPEPGTLTLLCMGVAFFIGKKGHSGFHKKNRISTSLSYNPNLQTS